MKRRIVAIALLGCVLFTGCASHSFQWMKWTKKLQTSAQRSD